MHERILSWIEKVAYKAVCIISLVIAGYLLIQDFVMRIRIDSAETVSFGAQAWWIYLLALAAMVALCCTAKKYIKKILTDKTLIWGTIVYAVLLLLFVVTVRMEPRADQRIVLQIADQVAKGDFSAWQKSAYCDMYPNQYGLIVIMAALTKFLGTYNWLAYQCLNVLFIILAAWGVRKSVSLVFENEAVASISYAISLLYLPLASYVTFVYGTLPGLACVSVGMYCLLLGWQKDRLLPCGIGALLVVAAGILKNNYLIAIIAVGIVGLFLFIQHKRWKIAFSIVLLAVVYLLLNSGVNLYIGSKTAVRDQGGIPSVAWVAMGLQDGGTKGPGWYTSYAKDVYWDHDSNKELAGKAAKESIRESLTKMKEDPAYGIDFFNKKTASQWNEATFESVWINQFRTQNDGMPGWLKRLYNDNSKVNHWYAGICDVVLFLIWFGIILFVIAVWREQDIRKIAWLILLIGGFLFHLFWEAKGQYTVVYVWLCIPYCIWGYKRMSGWMISLIQKKRA